MLLRQIPILGYVALLALAGCTPASTATSTPSATTPASTATWTATAAPSPTEPLPAATAAPVPAVPTSTATVAPVGIEESGWRLPLLAAALTQVAIQRTEELASSGGRPLDALGYGIALGAVDDSLAEWTPGAGQADYQERLRANIAGVGQVIGGWYDGGLDAARVIDALRPWRAESEQLLADLAGELRALGVSQTQIDAFLAEVMAGRD